MDLIEFFDKDKNLQAWQAGFFRDHRLLLTGLSDPIKALVMANAYRNNPNKYIVIVDTQFQANELMDQLSELVGADAVLQYFSDDNVYAEFSIASKDRTAYRLEALRFLLDEQSQGFLILPWLTMRTWLPDRSHFLNQFTRLIKGEEYSQEMLKHVLVSSGYTKVQRVMSPGEFALRGDILDFYPLDGSHPIRLEFFGDEIDKIRSFNAENQRSIQEFDQVVLSPATELIFFDEDFIRGVNLLSNYLGSLEKSERAYLEEIIDASTHHSPHPDIKKFLKFFYDKPQTLWDYIPKSAQIFVDDFRKIKEVDQKISTEVADFQLSETQMNRYIDGQTYLADTMSRLRATKPITFFSNFQRGLGSLKFDALYNFNQHVMQQFFGQLDLVYTEIDRLVNQGFTVILAVPTEKLARELTREKFDLQGENSVDLQEFQVNIIPTNFSSGFVFLDQKLAVMTEADIFGKPRKVRSRSLNMTNAERLKDYNELGIGDFVVHRVHGIGKYLGLQTLEINGVHKDYLTIEYQRGDTISVPIDHLDALTKYTAAEGKPPKINRLNDGRWRKTLSSVGRQVEDISDDLIKLYAERQSSKGFAFSPDDRDQEEFDQAFSYVETPDQLRSIAEIKEDMQKSLPMDRLLVGDVGFGKTEVAMRAAFKAINDGKQVAILVPTTVLSEQHYQTMSERLLDFGVNVAVLSRFQTKIQQREILVKLKRGQIDLIIGTHRLLSKDVKFSDLGLIIIDEEQRFGVKHKERLKELRAGIDVLTLTATPIPRTLHMSMLGIRDLSIIETPPTNRYPVQTYVMEKNNGVVRDSLLREMSRGGQAFYVYNRVDGIEAKVSELEELIPEARIQAIHGQMSESQLETTLLDFIRGDADLLVTTTIIETGVDIPNVNTLFIEQADRFGLSQLYQLRGRVGRTNRVAYAYLMYRPDRVLNDLAEKRLEAIKGFTELGSGFKIAMRDLAIRGAGNLLGAEQSGFIDSVGFDLYTELLEEAVQERMGQTKSQEKKLKVDSEISLGIDAFIPETYIQDERQKIEIYKRIHQISSQENVDELADELIDRFGDYPDQVAYLLEISLLKHFSDLALVEKIDRQREITIRFSKLARSLYPAQAYFEALSEISLEAEVKEMKGQMVIQLKVTYSAAFWLSECLKFVQKMANFLE